jgi:hypothetical protein
MSKNIIVTTGDLQSAYSIIGPVYFQVSNKGLFSNQLDKLAKQYKSKITQMKKQGQIGAAQADWGFLYGEWSVGQGQFETAFFVAVQELKKRANLLGADAIIGMRQDIDLDTSGFQYFYLQVYGTAVKIGGVSPVPQIPIQTSRIWEYSDLMIGRVNPTQPGGKPQFVVKLMHYAAAGVKESTFDSVPSALARMSKEGWELVGVYSIPVGRSASETHWTFQRVQHV